MANIKNRKDLISIITPTYNSELFIHQTIESVKSQTYKSWEMLIVDDCSEDGTRSIVQDIALKEPRVRLLTHNNNKGASFARNTALVAAEGRYIAFLDSDDRWLENKLEAQIEFMRNYKAGFCFTQFRRVNFDGKIGRVNSVPDQMTYNELLKNTAIATSTVLLDLEITGSVFMKDTLCDDLALWLDILQRGVTARGLQMDLMRYSVRPDSLSRNKVNWARGVWRVYREVEGLSLIHASWNFAHYAWRGWWKYRRF